MSALLRGRVEAIDGARVRLAREAGPVTVEVRGPMPALFDLVEIDAATGACRVLTRFRGDPARGARLTRRVLAPEARAWREARAAVDAAMRDTFAVLGFTEVRTPLMVPSPGMEPHIRPFAVTGAAGGAPRAYLHTSPEFAMKGLLAGGLERIWQATPVFRDEPESATHSPEFTMLEWYRAFDDERALQADVEALLQAMHARVPAPRRDIDFSAPWPRLSVRELFREHAGVDPTPGSDLAAACAAHGLATAAGDSWDDLYFRLWLAVVEPRLPADRPCFVERYPASQAALAALDQDADGTPWARRFEVYAGGLELGNAFYELTDADEQRRRFEADMALRAATYGDDFPASPLPEALLDALAEGLPPSAGIAMGVERLTMAVTGIADLAVSRP